jgi:hypothetical protein
LGLDYALTTLPKDEDVFTVEGHVRVRRKETRSKERVGLVSWFAPKDGHERLKANTLAVLSYSGMIQIALKASIERSCSISDVYTEYASLVKHPVAF